MSTSIAVTFRRMTCYAPLWLADMIDAEWQSGQNGITRSDVMRRWLERVALSKRKAQ